MIKRAIAAFLVVAAGCAFVVALSGSGGGGQAKTIKIAFDNAFGIAPGGDLRVAGVKAGQTTGFGISKGPECQLGHPNAQPLRTCGIITANITEPGFEAFKSNATCSIRQQSLIGEYYVDCQPGTSQQALPNNATIADTQTSSTIPTDLVQDVLRRPYRDRLRLIIGELGTGLAGRSQDLSLLLHRAAPGLRETDNVLRILANQDQTIKDFISTSNTVVQQLDQNKANLQRWVVEASRTAQISATRTQAISEGFRLLPTFLTSLQTTMSKLGALTDAQTPLLIDLQRAAPSLTTFLTELGPFSSAAIPATKSLGQASVVGTTAFNDGAQEIRELQALAADAPATAKPLRQFLQTLDSRARSADPDVRAADTAPPAPDPTQFVSGKGFTGFESILNYAYFQTLAINQFDPISHVLRIIGIVDPNCSNYQNDLRSASLGGTNPNANTIRQACNSYLGPFQPGVTSPDVTDTHNYQAKLTAPSTPGAQRVAGQAPATTPLPGQTDYSQPRPSLPPSVQGLVQGLGANAGSTANSATQSLPSVPSSGGSPTTASNTGSAPDPSTAGQALNFLLSP